MARKIEFKKLNSKIENFNASIFELLRFSKARFSFFYISTKGTILDEWYYNSHRVARLRDVSMNCCAIRYYFFIPYQPMKLDKFEIA